MKTQQILKILVLVATAPKVINLGEIRIEGEADRPTVSFVLPRAQLDFLNRKAFLDKKDFEKKITGSVKSDIFDPRR